ncbi:substrate-binding periplasmic protein [Ideonella sp. BN130291]|uniref:substrate-binding periplasmic protein n=1 Tax=Ideonella sp. BN130291 TaxID=3112940 RepID=UPI002E2750B9|nr:transporter substrate-binding domain-containing protein [Ideonella sp. BN130291]
MVTPIREPKSPRRLGGLAHAAAWLLAAATGLASAAERPVIKACGHHDYPPWNWQRGNEIVGACAVIAQRAIERLGYRVDLGFVGPWKRCQAMVASGEVDVNICAFRNPEREAYSVFAEPRMAQNRIAVFMQKQRAGNQRFNRWADLEGARTGLVLGVSMGPEFDDFLAQHTHIERVGTVRQALGMLSLNRVDILPFGWEAGLIEIARAGLSDQVVPLERPALVGDLWLSVSQKSPLASRVQEIGAYFTRPGYAQELQQALDDYHRMALGGAAKARSREPGPPAEAAVR